MNELDQSESVSELSWGMLGKACGRFLCGSLGEGQAGAAGGCSVSLRGNLSKRGCSPARRAEKSKEKEAEPLGLPEPRMELFLKQIVSGHFHSRHW